VRNDYQDLSTEAGQLSIQAQLQFDNSDGKITTTQQATKYGKAAVAVSASGGTIMGSGVVLMGSATWSTTTIAGACMGPPGWAALIGTIFITGGVAFVGGEVAKDTHEQIKKRMTTLQQVMQEIIQLVFTHSKQLEEICATLEKVTEECKALEKAAKTFERKQESGKNTTVPCQRAKRLLVTMIEDCQTLEMRCDEYIEAERHGQDGVKDIMKREPPKLW